MSVIKTTKSEGLMCVEDAGQNRKKIDGQNDERIIITVNSD